MDLRLLLEIFFRFFMMLYLVFPTLKLFGFRLTCIKYKENNSNGYEIFK